MTDPNTGLPILKARVEIDVVSASGDVAWSVYELDGSNCNQVAFGSSASSSPDAELDPGATYFVKAVRASGTSSVDFTMFVGT